MALISVRRRFFRPQIRYLSDVDVQQLAPLPAKNAPCLVAREEKLLGPSSTVGGDYASSTKTNIYDLYPCVKFPQFEPVHLNI